MRTPSTIQCPTPNSFPFLKMDVKSKAIPFTRVFLFLLLSSSFPISFSEHHHHQFFNFTYDPNTPTSAQSSVIFPIQGNVYPLGYYTVNLLIGNPPKVYDLDIDTGSDLAWVQCDAPCKGCTKPRDQLYKPKPGNLVPCSDPLCAATQSGGSSQHCRSPNEQCDYEVLYADSGSSLGVLVRDNIFFPFSDGRMAPKLAFGCGYDQKYSGTPLSSAGVLGLGSGRISILSQLRSLGKIRNVVGHCLSSNGGGFLFFGDNNKLIPSRGVVSLPISQSSSSSSATGPADLFFNGKATSVKGLDLIFDSGSSYTYLNSQAYNALLALITNDLKGQPLSRTGEDKSLPICWKGARPFRSVRDVTNYFKPLLLIFTRSRNAQLQLSPQAYLIVTKYGNVCLGILNGSEGGLGNTNIIGDISLQDKLVIYDNDNQQVGWIPADCDRRPES